MRRARMVSESIDTEEIIGKSLRVVIAIALLILAAVFGWAAAAVAGYQLDPRLSLLLLPLTAAAAILRGGWAGRILAVLAAMAGLGLGGATTVLAGPADQAGAAAMVQLLTSALVLVAVVLTWQHLRVPAWYAFRRRDSNLNAERHLRR